MMSDGRLTYLFNSYINKTASPEELQELKTYFDDPLYKDEILSLMDGVWDLSPGDLPELSTGEAEDVYQRITSQRRKNKPVILWKRFSAAAAVLFTVGLFTYYINHHKREQQIQTQLAAQKQSIRDIQPGNNKAILKLSSGKIVLLDSIPAGQLINDAGVIIHKAKDGQLVYEKDRFAVGNPNGLNTIEVPMGGEYMVTLTDGTRVFINSGSSLSYPTQFRANKRNIYLQGEAYFEVARNPHAPFKVNVLNRHTVQVLGTHFNIAAYPTDGEIRTTLTHGSVKVVSTHGNALLKPGESAVDGLSSKALTVTRVDTNEVLGWKNGYFIFNNENLRPILTKISRWYNVDVTVKGSISHINVMGNYKRNKTLLSLLKGIQLSNDIHYELKERRLIIIGK